MSGQRGPLTGAPGAGRPRRDGRGAAGGGAVLSRLPSVRPIAPPPVPRAPSGLGKDGRATWKLVWQSCPNLDVEKDEPIVTDLCHLHDQMARYRAALEEHGALLVEKIVSPRGEVVGDRLVASPASAQLKNAQAAAMAIYAALGLSPQARARLPR